MDHDHHAHMNHDTMDHSGHHMMAASTMGPSGAMMSKEVDHSTMDHSQMDHSQMDHSQHGGGMDHSQHGGGMDHMDMMKMYFHVGVKEVILFSGWKTTTVSEMIGSCICLFVCALLYEGLKVFREELLVKGRNDMMRRNTPESLPTNDETGENGVNSDQVIIHPSHNAKSKICNKWHFLQSFLHIVQVTVSYMLMLVFMTYNVWLCLAVALGAGAGYFCFGWRKQSTHDVNEHCH